jgi:hypothetical protein
MTIEHAKKCIGNSGFVIALDNPNFFEEAFGHPLLGEEEISLLSGKSQYARKAAGTNFQQCVSRVTDLGLGSPNHTKRFKLNLAPVLDHPLFLSRALSLKTYGFSGQQLYRFCSKSTFWPGLHLIDDHLWTIVCSMTADHITPEAMVDGKSNPFMSALETAVRTQQPLNFPFMAKHKVRAE